VALITISRSHPQITPINADVKPLLPSLRKSAQSADNQIRGLDVSTPRTAPEKAAELLTAEIKSVGQVKQLENPDARVTLDTFNEEVDLLEKIAESGGGCSSFDSPRFISQFWEYSNINKAIYTYCQTAPAYGSLFSGRSQLLKWENGEGQLAHLMDEKKRLENYSSGIWIVWSSDRNRRGL